MASIAAPAPVAITGKGDLCQSRRRTARGEQVKFRSNELRGFNVARRENWERRLGIAQTERMRKHMNGPFLDQLDRCKDDDARRLLLRDWDRPKPTTKRITGREGMQHKKYIYRRYARVA
jgi:hypothetical protein